MAPCIAATGFRSKSGCFTGVMGPPMYTVSGQMAQANRVAEPVSVTDVEDSFDTGENGNSENVTENIVVKRTRAATNGDVPEAKKTRV